MSDTVDTNAIYEVEEEDFDLKSYPFDPEDISIDKKPMVMDAIIRRFKQGTIIMHPDFQLLYDQNIQLEDSNDLVLGCKVTNFISINSLSF